MTKPKPQMDIYETTLDNPELEAKLESREKMKDELSTARHNFKIKDEQARAAIEELDLGEDAPVRVGRFVVEHRRRKGRSVSFETEPTTQLKIKTID